MNLPLIIGRSSANEKYLVDITRLPHLFISYSDEVQMHQAFDVFINTLIHQHPSGKLQFAFAFAVDTAIKTKQNLPNEFIYAEYIRNEYQEGKVKSKLEFWSILMKELKKRIRLLNKTSNASVELYNTTLVPTKLKKPLPFIIILIDDIFELVLSSTKKSGLSFLQLAVYGKQVGIHFITASSGTYRNLLYQLLHIHPTIIPNIIIT